MRQSEAKRELGESKVVAVGLSWRRSNRRATWARVLAWQRWAVRSGGAIRSHYFFHLPSGVSGVMWFRKRNRYGVSKSFDSLVMSTRFAATAWTPGASHWAICRTLTRSGPDGSSDRLVKVSGFGVAPAVSK